MVAPANGDGAPGPIPSITPGPGPGGPPDQGAAFYAKLAECLDWLIRHFWAALLPGLTVVIKSVVSVMDDLAALITELFTAAQATNTQGFFTLMAAVVEDLLGVPVSADAFQSAFRRGGDVAGVRSIGGTLFDQLTKEFGGPGEVTPERGILAGKAFLGFLMAFAIRQGNVEFITELLPESISPLGGVRSYGELMAKNLGLGRLARRALQPLLQIMIADPMTQYLNREHRPKMLGASQAIKAFNRNLIDEDTFNKEIAYDGYTEKRAAALTEETLEQLGSSELYTMLRFGAIDESQFRILMRRRGMHPVDADRYLQAAQFSEASTAVSEYFAVLRTQRLAGNIDAGTFADQVDRLPVSEELKRRWKDLLGQELEFPRKTLTLAELQSAYVEGLLDLEDVGTFLKREGYSDDDSTTLQYMTLGKLATLEAKQAVARYKWERAKAKAAAKGEAEPPMPAILAQ